MLYRVRSRAYHDRCMTIQPTRRRRRTSASPNSPTGATAASAQGTAATSRSTRRAPVTHVREHHVTTDYSYVHKDLILIAGVTTVVLGFIIGMSFVL